MGKKDAKASTAIVKKGSMALQPWMQEEAAQAKADAAKFQTATSRIQHKGGIFRIDKEPVKGNVLDVVVVEAIFGKAYYEGDFDDDNPQTPTCYAFDPDKEPKGPPHEASPDKQHDTCAGCPHNKFGTAERGNGKRCKDEIRLMCAVRTDDPDALIKGEFRVMTVPPGSLKNWGKYVASLRDNGLTFRAVWTHMSIAPLKGAYQILFEAASPLESEEMYLAVKSRGDAAKTEMMQPYPVLDSAEEKVQEKPRKRIKGQ